MPPSLVRSHSAGTELLMKARNLRKSFGGQVVLNGVSLDLHCGEVVLMRGENGSGKTTLLNILTGNLEPDSGSIWVNADGSARVFHFPFHWWQELNPFNHFTPEAVASEAVCRTWQDIRLFRTRSLLENVAAATPRQPGEDPFIVLARNRTVRQFEKNNLCECKHLLAQLGLVGRENSSADKVSLGQMKRAAIARAVRAGARILFLDEPLSGLDGEGIEDILALLRSLAQQDQITLVIVEHVFNIPRVLSLAHTVWTLHDGTIQVDKATSVSGSVPQGYECLMRTLVEQLGGPGCQIQKRALYGGASLIRLRRSAEPTLKAPVMDVQGLVAYRNNRLVVGRSPEGGSLEGLSLELRPGEVAILSAPNGWGKTTLLEALAGVIPIAQGQVSYRNVNIHQLPSWKRSRLGLRYISSRNNLFPSLSMADFQALTDQALSNMDRLPDLQRRIGELSGGERQQLAIAGLLMEGDLVMLDEPFLGLDAKSVALACERLVRFLESTSGALLIAMPATADEAFQPTFESSDTLDQGDNR